MKKELNYRFCREYDELKWLESLEHIVIDSCSYNRTGWRVYYHFENENGERYL